MLLGWCSGLRPRSLNCFFDFCFGIEKVLDGEGTFDEAGIVLAPVVGDFVPTTWNSGGSLRAIVFHASPTPADFGADDDGTDTPMLELEELDRV